MTRRTRTRGKSLAVLPFVNAGADPTLEHVADGITESIINSLSQLSGLRVVPRSLAFRYKGLQADPATVGLALNARTILTGRVAQHGDVLNIQAELVDTRTESQLWGEQFRQSMRDLVTVQEEIAWQISEALRLKLTGEQKKKLQKRTDGRPGRVPGIPPRPLSLEQFFARTASGGRANISNARSRSIPPTRLRMRVLATRSARWPITAIIAAGRGIPARCRGRPPRTRARSGHRRRAHHARHRAAVLGLGLAGSASANSRPLFA